MSWRLVGCCAATVFIGVFHSIAFAQNTTVQLPQFGVAIDADGVLSIKSATDPRGLLHAKRVAETRVRMPVDLAAPSKLRKISLLKLEQAVREKIEAGEEPTDAMKHLAGLQRVEYVFFYPDENDIVIAGPAEMWVEDGVGRVIGATTRRPVLLLEDLIVALRAYAPGTRDAAFIGCSIDPDREGLSRLQAFQRTVPRVISQSQRAAAGVQIARGMQNALGMGNIRVFGVSEKTHMAQVLIEADYRMKLIGIGLEPPPVKMATFIKMLSGAQHSTLQRWWFTPDYKCVRISEDKNAMQLVGQGVQLLGEDKLIGADGALAPSTAKPNKASELFTTSFTKKYPEIAAASPAFAQMRNMIDLLVASAFIRQQHFYSKVGANLGVFADEDALPVETLNNPKTAPCAVNSVWKGSRLFTPAGGGVSIRPDHAFDAENLLPTDGQADEVRRSITPKETWWWD